MKKKKIIIISVFLVLIAITSAVFIKGAIDSYNYDMDPANGIDIMEGMGAVLILMVGGFLVFYELDLFYAVYYFFVKPKNTLKTVAVIISNASLLLVLFSEKIIDLVRKYLPGIADATTMEEAIIPVGLMLIYAVSKLICLMSTEMGSEKHEKKL